MIEVRFYGAELRGLLACASTDDARPMLCALHFAADGRRVWTTNGHVMAMRYEIGADPWERTEPRAIGRDAFDLAALMCDSLDECGVCDECGGPDEHPSERVALDLFGNPMSLHVAAGSRSHRLGLDLQTLTASPPAWLVLPRWETVGEARGRVFDANVLGKLTAVDEGIRARHGRPGQWCIGFAPEATLPNGQKQAGHFGPLVARTENDGYGWLFVAMPLRPMSDLAVPWHAKVNGYAHEGDDA